MQVVEVMEVSSFEDKCPSFKPDVGPQAPFHQTEGPIDASDALATAKARIKFGYAEVTLHLNSVIRRLHLFA